MSQLAKLGAVCIVGWIGLITIEAAHASCERHIYNQSKSYWVVAVGNKGGERTRGPANAAPEWTRLSKAEQTKRVRKRRWVLRSNRSGWILIIPPKTNRLIHYDDT